MPFAARHRDDVTAPLTELPELTFARVEDIVVSMRLSTSAI